MNYMTGNKYSGKIPPSILFMAGAIGPFVYGCGSGAIPPEQAVFFDIEAKQAVVFPATIGYPAIHPVTGHASLMPAMYCPKCSVWRQVPMPDQINRTKQPITCAKCKSIFEIQGPFPRPEIGN